MEILLENNIPAIQIQPGWFSPTEFHARHLGLGFLFSPLLASHLSPSPISSALPSLLPSSLLFLLSLSSFFLLFLILRYIYVKGRATEKGRELFHLLAQSLNGHNSLDRVRLKPGSKMAGVQGTQAPWPSFAASQKH